ncbi:hypothetical protein FNF27_07824 [Cafeteria roenbergensis]|uniref:EGF-like domain-containing protein n=1 Tax=Cafeteria roenbergensis TaxID=33653 RepID=A0A5A8DHQ3_CAFRO|nr:hypothetical protein FNF27_07824 [Cafeteria roenbergensis]
MHNVSLMLEKAVVFGSDRLFLWPIRVPPGTAALTVEGVLVQQRDSTATPVLLIRTGGRVPTTENFDAAEAFLPPLAETVQEARAEAAAAAAKARQDTLADTGNATAAEDAAAAAATAAIDAEASSVGSGTGSAHARASARVVLHGQSDTVFAAVWGGRALFSNTYPQTSHTRDVSVRLRARAEVCSPPTAPSDGDCLRVGSGVFLLPGVSGSHKVEDLSGGLAWTFTLVGAVPGLQASPDRAVQDITIPRFTSAMTITLARWKDASDARLSVRIRAEACVQGAAGAEDGEGLDRPVTMTAACDADGWEVASVTAEKPGQTRSVTVLLPRAGRWVAVASLTGPTEDLDPNPVTAAVTVTTGGMPLAYHLDVPGHARVAAEDAGGKGAPVIAPADFTLAPENARVVKSVGAGFTELVWELERPPPGEWFVAIVHSPAGTDLVCEDVLSPTDLAVMDEGLLAQGAVDGAAAVAAGVEAAGAAETVSSADAEAQALAELAGGSDSADGASARAGATADMAAHPAGKSAGTKGRHGDSGAGPSDPDAEVVATATFTDGSGSAAGSTASSRAGSSSGSPMLGGVAMLGAVSRQPTTGRGAAEPAPISPQTRPIGAPASGAGSAEASGSADSTSMSARATSGLMAIENTLSAELGEVMNLAKQYLAELGFSSGTDEAEARRRAALLYNPADRLYAISATLTACSAHCSGQCTLLRSEGYVAGQCVCTNPYRFAGDYCDEETGSVPFYSLSTGLLVLSNAAMLPAVLLALRWHLWGEAVVLAGAALSSALYHTCDQYLFCFSSTYHSLQAMDISGSYLAVAVSLMLLAGLPQSARLALAIALLAVFLFTLDNPASLGRAAGLAVTVAVALLSLVAGVCYSVLRNFAAWSKVAARATQAEERAREREARQLTAPGKSADASGAFAGAGGAGAGGSGAEEGAEAEEEAGDLFDGDALAAAFVGDEEPDSGASFYGDGDDDGRRGSGAAAEDGGAVVSESGDEAEPADDVAPAITDPVVADAAADGAASEEDGAAEDEEDDGGGERRGLLSGAAGMALGNGSATGGAVSTSGGVGAVAGRGAGGSNGVARSASGRPISALSSPTHTPIAAPQAAPAWCTARARRALVGSAELLLFKSGNFRWKWIYTALALFGLALLLVLVSTNGSYWITHSLWHCAIMGVPAALILARVDPRGPLLVFDASARRRVGIE